MKKRGLTLLLLMALMASLAAGCGKAEQSGAALDGEPKQSFFDELGINVPDGPVGCTVDYIYYNEHDPETYCRVGDAVWHQTDCYAEPVDEDEYQNIHLTLKVVLQPGAYHDAGQDVSYYPGVLSNVYDWYTGDVIWHMSMNMSVDMLNSGHGAVHVR